MKNSSIKRKDIKKGFHMNITITCTPHSSMRNKTARANLDLNTAISEPLENSSDAQATKVDINFHPIGSAGQLITMEDNGIGMDIDDLQRAMSFYTSDKDQDDLGENGVGLKMGCGYLASKWTIETTKAGNDRVYSVQEDVDTPAESFDYEVNEKPANKEDHFTKICLQSRIKYRKKDIENLRDFLGKRYHRIIQNGFQIKINGKDVAPKPIQYSKDLPIIRNTYQINGHEVKMILGLKDPDSWKRNDYGVDFYKKDRIIESNLTIGFGPFQQGPQQMRGFSLELDMSSCETDQNKKSIKRDSEQYRSIEDAINKDPVVKDWIKQLVDLNTGKNKTKEISKQSFDKLLDVAARAAAAMSKDPTLAGISNAGVSRSNKGQPNPINLPTNNINNSNSSSSNSNKKNRQSNKNNVKPTNRFTVGGKNYNLEIRTNGMPDQPMVLQTNQYSNGTLIIDMNTSADLWLHTNNVTASGAVCVGDAIGEFCEKELKTSSDQARDIRLNVISNSIREDK